MEDKLPIYEVIIDLDDNSEMGMQVVSFVDFPAIETDFLSFEKQELIKLAVQDEDKHLCYGPIALANKPIYRRTEEGFEYYIVFTPDNIEKMLQKYMKENKGNNVDENHSFELQDGVTLYQVFIKDTAKGINPTDFPDAEDGSLFGIYHVENEELWADVKDGKVKGFSLAGLFDMKKVDTVLNINKPNKEDKKTMSKLSKVKEMLKAMLEVFGDVSTNKGTLIYDGDDEIKVGDAVKLLDGEGNEVDAEDGDYETDDQRIIVVADGKVTEIKDKEVEEPSNEEETPEEDVNASAQEPEDSKIKQAFIAMAEATNETYDEKYRKIYAAIYDKGYEYAYVVEASDEYAIISSWGEDELEHYFKFDLTWDEEGNVSASDPVEVKRTYVPVDEEPEQEEPAQDEEPAEEPTPEEAKSAALSAQEQFAALDNEPKATKTSKKAEEMHKRGYKF